jgi:hypothetical protein
MTRSFIDGHNQLGEKPPLTQSQEPNDGASLRLLAIAGGRG